MPVRRTPDDGPVVALPTGPVAGLAVLAFAGLIVEGAMADWSAVYLRAAALGLTAAPFNESEMLEFIPHMDGFPNGRRLEDDVTTIELQAVAGLVLAAVGLPEDDATAAKLTAMSPPSHQRK